MHAGILQGHVRAGLGHRWLQRLEHQRNGAVVNHDLESTDPTNPLSSVPIAFSPTLTVDPTTGQFIPCSSAMDAYNFGALNYHMRHSAHSWR